MHFVYKTVCVITGKYYIGVHSTLLLEDGYLGSGTRLKRSVKKYGPENHTREILRFFDTSLGAYSYEEALVTQELIESDLLCMNLKPGGLGGWKDTRSETQRARWEKGNKVLTTLRTTNPEWVKKFSESRSISNTKSYLTGTRNATGAVMGELRAEMTRRASRPEAKEKRITSFKVIAHQKGERNSQFGTCWVSNRTETKKIRLEELDHYLSLGYNRGRKKK